MDNKDRLNTHDILFIPGPVEVDRGLRRIMSSPLVGHRSPAFQTTVKAVCSRLASLFGTQAYALFENCPATALMDASVRNLVRGPILHLVCGAFGERWHEASRACGRQAEVLAVPWGEVVSGEMLAERLEDSPPFEAVAITHSETSTGALNPLRELASVVRHVSPDTLVLVDAVSSLAAAELQFDQWGLDLVFAGTQKALALPPGLCVFALSERALARAEASQDRGLFLDFVRTVGGLAQGKTVATPCVPLVLALSSQLDRIGKEGLTNRWQRHKEMQALTFEWAREHNFEFFVKDPDHRSPAVSALRASGRDVGELIARAREGGFVLARGYGRLKDETFRIGHMGDHSVARLRDLLSLLS